MVNIGGQDWQDEEAYIAFMTNNNMNTAPSISKTELLERDLERLSKAIKDKKESFEMTLRAGNDVLIRPGESILVPTGISTAMLEDYEQNVNIITALNSNSWLRVAPSLVSKMDLSYLDLKNFAQFALARRMQLRCILSRTLPEDSSIYIQDVEDLTMKIKEPYHVAYYIAAGGEIATLKLCRK